MANIKIASTSAGQWRLGSFQDYDIKNLNLSKGKMVLEYSEAKAGAFRPERSPFKIEIKFTDAETYQPARGDYAGQTLLFGGQTTRVTMFDQDGDVIQLMTGLSMDAGLMHLTMLRNPWALFGHLIADGAEVTVAQNDNFVQAKTGGGNDVVTVRSSNGSYLEDSIGSDTYLGHRTGYDILSLEDHFWNNRPDGTGATVNFGKGTVTGIGDDVDTFKRIDEVRGTMYDDTFIGNKKDNQFQGGRGDDFINGRGGFDIARYDFDDNTGGFEGIIANMAKNTVRDGYRTVDKLKNIEGVSGSDFDDVFISGGKNDWFRGRDGADTFRFNGLAFGNDTIRDFDGAAGDTVALNKVSGFRKLTVEELDDGTLVTINGDSSIMFRDYFDVSASDFDFG